MAKLFALLVVASMAVAMSMASPIDSVVSSGAELSQSELLAAQQMSQVALKPSEEEEYAQNNIPEFNNYCVTVKDYVFNKFDDTVTDAKLSAWKAVFEALAPAGSTAVQLQAIITKLVRETANERLNVPQELRPNNDEENQIQVDAALAEEFKKIEEEGGNENLVTKIKMYVATGVSTFIQNAKAQVAAQIELLKSKTRDATAIARLIEGSCLSFRHAVSNPVSDMFVAYRDNLADGSPDAETANKIRRVEQTEVRCVTAGRVRAIETFCRAVPALLPFVSDRFKY